MPVSNFYCGMYCIISCVLFACQCDTATNGVVLATEKKQKSVLYDEHSISKVEPITKNIGIVYSGMGLDNRWV